MSGQRGLRSAQAEGEAEQAAILALVATGHQCRGCGRVSVGVYPPDAVPADLPQRGADARVLRALDLEATGAWLAWRLAELVADSTFALWLGPLRLIDAGPGTLWLWAPRSIATWVRDRFSRVLDRAASDCAGVEMRCRVVTAPAVEAWTLSELFAGGGTA